MVLFKSVLRQREREKACLFVVVERVEELVVFPREGTEEKMFCCLFVFSFFYQPLVCFCSSLASFCKGGVGYLLMRG